MMGYQDGFIENYKPGFTIIGIPCVNKNANHIILKTINFHIQA